MDLIDCLNLEDNLTSHYDVEAMVTEEMSSIENWNLLFPLERNATLLEFDTDRPRIDAFKEPRSESTMDDDAATDRAMNEGLDGVGQCSWNPQHDSLFFVSSRLRGYFVSSSYLTFVSSSLRGYSCLRGWIGRTKTRCPVNVLTSSERPSVSIVTAPS